MEISVTVRWKRLLLTHLGIALLLSTLFWPWTAELWQKIDVDFFSFTNNSLVGHENWQLFWALGNHSLADWIIDLFILAFYSIGIWRTAPSERRKRFFSYLFCILFIALILISINRLLCRDILKLRRDSPTLVFDGCLRLSDLLPSIKDNSTKSFPGDHATLPLLFAFTYAFFSDRKGAICAFLFAGLLCLPRLMAGAHWLSDLIVGSGSIVLFAMSWLLFTPIARTFPLWLSSLFERKAVRRVQS